MGNVFRDVMASKNSDRSARTIDHPYLETACDQKPKPESRATHIHIINLN